MKRYLAALCLVLAGLSGSANAQTIGFADAIDILARSCGNDIASHCPTANLANFEIGRCLQQNQARLSGTCATDLVRVRQSLDARFAAQASVPQVCNRDIQRLCPTNLVRGGPTAVLRCLTRAERSVSARCNEAITNAGYR